MNRYEITFREEIIKRVILFANSEEHAENLIATGEYIEEEDLLLDISTENEEFIEIDQIEELG